MTRALRLIGAASGVGAQDPGCHAGPTALHRAHAFDDLNRRPDLTWGEMLFPRQRLPGRVAEVADLCGRLAREVAGALDRGETPVVLGGDHSCAIGTWSGVKSRSAAPIGLLWLDALLDSHTPESSHSGALHGMPLACLLGQGDRRLVTVGGPAPKLLPQHVALIGARSYEPEEAEFLGRLGVRVYGSEEMGQRGLPAVFAEALARVRGAPGGYGLSLDLDVLDPREAPGVGSPEPEGLSQTALMPCLAGLAGDPRLLGLEVMEFNPDRDAGGRTAALLARVIGAVFPRD